MMAHEILSVKLCQLYDRLESLHTHIHMSEIASHDQLQQEIAALKQECKKTDEILKTSLYHSKSPVTSVLSPIYGQIERNIQETDVRLRKTGDNYKDDEALAEEKILLAEYALDFAHRAADRALLLSLEAIDAQMIWQQKEGETL